MSRRARHRARCRGQILIGFALAMGLFLVSLFAMVIDLAAVFGGAAGAQAAAQVAAQAGANDLDVGQLYSGTVALERSDAPGHVSFAVVCRRVGDASAHTAIDPASIGPTTPPDPAGDTACTNPAANTVTATVTRTVRLPLPIFGIAVTVRSDFSAAPVSGTCVPSGVAGSCP